MQETWVRFLGQEDPLEKRMATHSSIPAWRIPWTEEPGGLQSMGSQRVRHIQSGKGGDRESCCDLCLRMLRMCCVCLPLRALSFLALHLGLYHVLSLFLWHLYFRDQRAVVFRKACSFYMLFICSSGGLVVFANLDDSSYWRPRFPLKPSFGDLNTTH